MKDVRAILDKGKFQLTLKRLAFEVIENYPKWDEACIIGIQESGVLLSERLAEEISKITKTKSIPLGKLDITFYRDDFRLRDTPLEASKTELNFDIENRRVLLVDDVLYTGRTVHAAMAALFDFGRPSQVELLSLVDRRFLRHMPIQADYKGIVVDALDDAYVKVHWDNTTGNDQILLFSPQN